VSAQIIRTPRSRKAGELSALATPNPTPMVMRHRINELQAMLVHHVCLARMRSELLLLLQPVWRGKLTVPPAE
jgi:hypothetical protein